MPHIDPLEQFAANPLTVILVDRRSRHIDEAARIAGLYIVERWTMPDPVGGAEVHAALLAPAVSSADFAFPRRIETVDTCYTRLVDRFYVPENPGPEVSSALFDTIAAHYDQLTNQDVNAAVCRRLLQAVVSDPRSEKRRVLDFGCGTGIAVSASRNLSLDCGPIELVGTDAAPAMLRLAAHHGEATIDYDAWRLEPPGSFDGAIAAFVLHYGIPDADLVCIAEQLKTGAQFAGNVFKPRSGSIDRIVDCFSAHGLVLLRQEQLDTTSSENPMLVFIKVGEVPMR